MFRHLQTLSEILKSPTDNFIICDWFLLVHLLKKLADNILFFDGLDKKESIEDYDLAYACYKLFWGNIWTIFKLEEAKM